MLLELLLLVGVDQLETGDTIPLSEPFWLLLLFNSNEPRVDPMPKKLLDDEL